ncbi:MAG TPA: PAAR domain-containing protein [Pseudomonas sp.]|uniref:PAAR domain-containing protein n=1 Tax=Pseudomonas sp. TaxID=306 RepID=UPI002ED9C3DF
MTYTREHAQALIDKHNVENADRTLKDIHLLATKGGKTEKGGEIKTASSEINVDGHDIACVGDIVCYPDGSQTTIVSGAGFAMAYMGRPIAILGSATENGDIVTTTLQNSFLIQERVDEPILGLFEPGYIAPRHPHP